MQVTEKGINNALLQINKTYNMLSGQSAVPD